MPNRLLAIGGGQMLDQSDSPDWLRRTALTDLLDRLSESIRGGRWLRLPEPEVLPKGRERCQLVEAPDPHAAVGNLVGSLRGIAFQDVKGVEVSLRSMNQVAPARSMGPDSTKTKSSGNRLASISVSLICALCASSFGPGLVQRSGWHVALPRESSANDREINCCPPPARDGSSLN